MWTITNNKSWNALGKISWVNDMQSVPQSPVHHAEGNVAVHTQMVLQAMEALPEYQSLAANEQEMLWAAALLHDVEKRSCTFTDDKGDVVSPGHARKGAQTTRQILYRELPTPFMIREEVVGLVRYHGLPLWVFDKQSPVQYLLRASLETNTRLLAILAKADALGRICNDQSELLYKISLFEELCREQDCWGKPKVFANGLARFQYFRKDDRTTDYVPFDDYRGEAILLSGIAASGKDYYAKKNFAEYPLISLDDMRRKIKAAHNDAAANGRIIQEAKEMAKNYLRKGQSFVWNATNITAQLRGQLIDLFDDYRAKTRIIYIETPYRELLSQNKNRQHPILEPALERMIDKLEVPKLWEACKVDYILK
jgi:predicted kinase